MLGKNGSCKWDHNLNWIEMLMKIRLGIWLEMAKDNWNKSDNGGDDFVEY